MIVDVNGWKLESERVANIKIYSADISNYMPEPQIPMFYIEDQDRWVENRDHPTYHAALSVYFANRQIALFDFLLRHYVKVVDKERIFVPKNIKRIYPDEDDEFLFLKHILFAEQEEAQELVNLITLTETRVYPIFNSLHINRNGMDIHQHDVKNSINTNIEFEPLVIAGHQLVHPLDEYNACIAAHGSYPDWVEQKLDLNTMATTVALYRINKIVEIHSGDAQQIESERAAKKNKQH